MIPLSFLTFPPKLEMPPPPKSFCNPMTAEMTKAILAMTKALVAIKAKPPRAIGMMAKTLAAIPMMIGKSDFFNFPRPGMEYCKGYFDVVKN